MKPRKATVEKKKASYIEETIKEVDYKKVIEKKINQPQQVPKNSQPDLPTAVKQKEIIQVPDADDLIDPVGLYQNPYATAKVGDKLVMNNLYFYDRSGIFVPESLPVMEELLEFMITHQKVKIEIQGHICCQLGEDPEDIALVRAISVHNYLVANDIDDSRLLYKSFGSTQPLHKIPERNEKERNENRRVEILILEN